MVEMNKTSNLGKPIDSITTDVKGAMELLSVGRATACKVGRESGAMFKLGNRLLFRVDKLQAYINKVSEEQNEKGA